MACLDMSWRDKMTLFEKEIDTMHKMKNASITLNKGDVKNLKDCFEMKKTERLIKFRILKNNHWLPALSVEPMNGNIDTIE